MKCGREGGAESKAEKESGGDADNSSEDSEKNCANGKVIYCGLHGSD